MFSILFLACLSLLVGCGKSDEQRIAQSANRESGVDSGSNVTFNDISLVVWEKCACCHRDGEAAPFPLVQFTDVAKRRDQILEVVQSGYMPPWLPDSPHGVYANDTRLSPQQKTQLVAWLQSGAPEGDASLLAPQPIWPDGWQLGTPDLVVSMPTAFELPASGPDVYRNFVIPIPVQRQRFVRGMEFRPGNYRVVHHAFMLIDPAQRLRGLTESDGQPGFGGMDTRSAVSPGGHFVGWQPGRRPYEAPAGMPWRLQPKTDLVVQVHMQCTGKPESLQLAIGLFFTDQPPTRSPAKLALLNTDIDIQPGDGRYEIEDRFQLPVDVDVMAVAPHAHYLAKEMYGIARLPDGTTKPLLSIKDWDLNWQSEYRFQTWMRLPAGTVLHQRYVYDNSPSNFRNPNSPPKRVVFGPEATDEMGSLWVQLIAANDGDASKLNQAITVKTVKETLARKRQVLQTDPGNVDANIQLGKIAIMTKQFPMAIQHFKRAATTDPKSVEAIYYWGNTLLRSNHLEEGVKQLDRCLRLDPTFSEAHYDLGQAAMMTDDYALAERHLRSAVRILEHDALTLKQLGKSLIKQGKLTEGIAYLEKSMTVTPDAKLIKTIESLREQLSVRRQSSGDG